MIRAVLLMLALSFCVPARALTDVAREFMKITDQLEAVQCEKRKLRRAIALAEVESREAEARTLRQKFADLDRDPRTARLQQRLAELGKRLEVSPDPEDLPAINRQRVEAFYRCE